MFTPPPHIHVPPPLCLPPPHSLPAAQLMQHQHVSDLHNTNCAKQQGVHNHTNTHTHTHEQTQSNAVRRAVLRIRRANDNQLKHAPADNNTAWWWEWLQSVPILNFDMKPRYPQPCDQHTILYKARRWDSPHTHGSMMLNCDKLWKGISGRRTGASSLQLRVRVPAPSDYLTCCRCLLCRQQRLFGLYACSAITIRLGLCRRLLGLCRCSLLHHTHTNMHACEPSNSQVRTVGNVCIPTTR